MSDHTNDSELIDAYGGTSKVAALCGLTTGAVSQWRTNGIPKAWKEVLRLAKPKVFKTWDAKRSQAEEARAA
ncbi:Cro/CI family transcriptional regulator [Achromobacter spanius]|uniref:Cro/CI family transcriptional regulator n=1 Tax=Achromobacter spanius TaxID=217203 RepID=UPI0022278FAD|nr:Cro/CI family transcriptional regulator [Achromobacter spanius]MCW3151926.1 Cro/CI family transcriptional regulator [Achromobacter spanius]